ncbi:hypothetical protein MJN54_31650, partial [Salmonella enterica subsp. enterica serovar Kentucky]|nr:hypothetical protein [Salmonella enterica subsp. enterica serovar Kentucky]
QHSVVPGLLHKYQNRALLLVKGGCAVNCRYCFRRHFPYAENHHKREVYDRGNGATILLYNSTKKTVVLVRQFRVATWVNGNQDG